MIVQCGGLCVDLDQIEAIRLPIETAGSSHWPTLFLKSGSQIDLLPETALAIIDRLKALTPEFC
jgi:hypothetical protein